jgi:hypothetical protein
MQRGQGSTGSGVRRTQDWTEAARAAAKRASAGPGSVKIACPGNLLLYFFLV